MAHGREGVGVRALVVVVVISAVGIREGHTSPTPQPPPLVPHPTPDLLALTQDFWHWKTQDFPQFATQVGINDNTAGRLDTLTHEHFLQRKSKCEEFLRRAQSIQPDSLSHQDFINLEILKEELNTYINNFEYMKYFVPITFLDGPQLSFKRMVETQMTLTSYNDYQKLLSRYGEFPRQADEILEIMRGNIRNKLMPSNWSLVGVVEQLEKLGGPVEDSVFFKPFVHTPSTVTRDQRITLRQQAHERIEQDLLPSFKKIRDFIEEEYFPATRPDVAATSLAGGNAYYSACLRYHTTTQLTPQEIHNLGLSEISRIEEEVLKTAEEIGLEGKTFSEISKALKADPDQQFNSKDDLLSTYRQAIYSKIYPLMEQLFTTVPTANVTVEGRDNPNAIFATYTPSSMDGSRLGTFYLNSHIYDKHKKYDVTALSLHEAVPGHHLHYSYMRMDPATPDFRKFIDYSRYGDIPAKFPLHTVFVEGWGLYSEFLGEELGLYKDPYQRLGRYSFELLRACRLVADTGLHVLGWTREKAVTFLLDHTALSEEAIQIEINRYITWPGQACAYKIGEIKIKELRQKAQSALGDLFRIYDFHDVLLTCTGPLSVLEKCVNHYIEKTITPIVIVKDTVEEDNAMTHDSEDDGNGSNNRDSQDGDKGEKEGESSNSDSGASSPLHVALCATSVAVILTVNLFHVIIHNHLLR